jgi:hypothetical protein
MSESELAVDRTMLGELKSELILVYLHNPLCQGWAAFMIKRATILHHHHQRAM